MFLSSNLGLNVLSFVMQLNLIPMYGLRSLEYLYLTIILRALVSLQDPLPRLLFLISLYLNTKEAIGYARALVHFTGPRPSHIWIPLLDEDNELITSVGCHMKRFPLLNIRCSIYLQRLFSPNSFLRCHISLDNTQVNEDDGMRYKDPNSSMMDKIWDRKWCNNKCKFVFEVCNGYFA